MHFSRENAEYSEVLSRVGHFTLAYNDVRGQIDVITNERKMVNIAVMQPSAYGCTREVAKHEKKRYVDYK